MQIFALEKNELVGAFGAERGKNYFCPECGWPVRIKAGPMRSSHFFHIKRPPRCRQAQKGPIHLRLQRYIRYLFEEEAEMEKRFDPINRIADVACTVSKKIYEIQYSPISLEEAKARCRDYESLGFQVIWILHEDRFNRRKKSPAERFLQTKTCYYTNMDKEGNGVIYDTLPNLGKKPINLRKSYPLPVRSWPPLLSHRTLRPLFHEGDFFDLALKKRLPLPKKPEKIFTKIKEGYLALLHMLLERSCK